MSRIVLKGEDLYKTFEDPHPVEVLRGASLELKEGESLAIVGKSGEGKSTLLNILGTLEPACKGKLYLLGKEVEPFYAPTIRNKHLGFIFQAYNLLEEDTLLENVLMPARIGRTLSKATRDRAIFLLEQVGLVDRKDFLAKKLSGGEKQRAAIARALLNDPEIIFADEPTGNLDRGNSQKIHELLLEASKKYKKALIIVTHDKELASLCDRALILKDGKLDSSWTSS